MRCVFIALIGVAVCAFGAGGGTRYIDKAEAFFLQGDYGAGLDILSKGANDKELTVEQQCEVLGLTALACEEFTGDYERAIETYKLILQAGLLPSDPAKTAARTNMMRLEAIRSKYSQQNAVLDQFAREEALSDKDNIREKMTLLQKIAAERPDYYRLAEVHYYQGLCSILLGKDDEAWSSFAKAVALKPGLDVYLPVEKYRATVRKPAASGSGIRHEYLLLGCGIAAGITLLWILATRRRKKTRTR